MRTIDRITRWEPQSPTRYRRNKSQSQHGKRLSKSAVGPDPTRLTGLQQLGGRWWSLSDCIRTSHSVIRSVERNVSWHDMHAAWTWGDWHVDATDPETFIVAWNDCELVVTFLEETPILVTVVSVAALRAA